MEQNNKYSHNSNSIKIGITQGDFNGISYEMVINSLVDETICDIFTPVFFGTSKLVSYFRKMLKVDTFSFQLATLNDIVIHKPNLINIFQSEVKINLGTQTEEAADLSLLSLNTAYDAIKSHAIDAIVCCPISLGLLKNKAPEFNGNSEFFAKLSKSENTMKILCKDNLRIAMATDKIKLCDINNNLNVNMLCNQIRHLDYILKNDLMISSPKIAVLSVNPINEQGQFVGGNEEQMIAAAIKLVANDNVFAFGPYNPSQLFLEKDYKVFDAILTTYEQQAHTIFSLLNGKDGAIYTAGLPFTVTEPFCIAGYDKAGKCIADSQCLRYAMYLAKDVTINRLENYRLKKKALKIIPTSDTSHSPSQDNPATETIQ